MDVKIPQTDFAKIACGMGADSIRVERESDIQPVLEKVMASKSPFIVDVTCNITSTPQAGSRNQSLISQVANK